jgi:antitoxin component of MazEF toxin-antitoxin module
MDAANSQSLRSAVDQGLTSGEARSATQVLDRLEAKYAALVDAEKMIDEIADDNLHHQVGTGKPVGKEVL